MKRDLIQIAVMVMAIILGHLIFWKMAVEIFREPELEEMISSVDNIDEWKSQIESLGLEGQKKLVEGDSNPSVYIHMNNGMKNMFGVLCPRKVDYKKYDKSTIPIDVLREISLCVCEKYFHSIQIWYDDVDPDPVVVGKIANDYNSPLHLIARWGDEILPFSELATKAKIRLTGSVKKQYELMANRIDSEIDKFMSGGYASLMIDFNTPSGDLPF